MEPRIVNLSEKKLAGKSLEMSLASDKTVELWKSFMPVRKNIQNLVSPSFYSMQVYDKDLDYDSFSAQTEFIKWAAVEVSDFNDMPESLEKYELKGGLYAVFIHKGPASEFYKTSQYIFQKWLPESEYKLDQREHFELLGEKYNPADANSEEEVWLPVTSK